MARPPLRIASARSPADLDAARTLFAAYAASLGVDLSYQGFEAELAALPGAYAPPSGALLLARAAEGGEPLGCVAVRPMDAPGCCEMKRFYVSPAARGLGLGRALLDAAVEAARTMGHREMRLDTLPFMSAAAALYRRAGFVEVAPYYHTPVAGTLFMARDLTT